MFGGPAAGGNLVTIRGQGLCDPSEKPSVKLAGVVATMVTYTPGEIVVIAGAVPASASLPKTGDIIIDSALTGNPRLLNGFTYYPGTLGCGMCSLSPRATHSVVFVSLLCFCFPLASR